MNRPAGVIVLAVLNFLGAALCLLGALAFLLGAGLSGAHAAAGHASGPAAFLLGLGAIGGVIFLIFAAIAVAIGLGLLKLKNWARIVTLILAVLSIFSTLFGLGMSALRLSTAGVFGVFSLVLDVILLAFYAWIVWYMLRPHVKTAFGVT